MTRTRCHIKTKVGRTTPSTPVLLIEAYSLTDCLDFEGRLCLNQTADRAYGYGQFIAGAPDAPQVTRDFERSERIEWGEALHVKIRLSAVALLSIVAARFSFTPPSSHVLT
jgi:hypothetical protein